MLITLLWTRTETCRKAPRAFWAQTYIFQETQWLSAPWFQSSKRLVTDMIMVIIYPKCRRTRRCRIENICNKRNSQTHHDRLRRNSMIYSKQSKPTAQWFTASRPTTKPQEMISKGKASRNGLHSGLWIIIVYPNPFWFASKHVGRIKPIPSWSQNWKCQTSRISGLENYILYETHLPIFLKISWQNSRFQILDGKMVSQHSCIEIDSGAALGVLVSWGSRKKIIWKTNKRWG